MVPILSLWAPILLSAVLVFIASSVLHMVLPYHRGDYKKLPKEDDVLDVIRRAGVTRGDYLAPHPSSPAGMKDPAFVDRMQRGPWLMMTVAPGGSVSMAAPLTQWFLACLVVSLFAGYLASRAVPPGGDYLEVFRFAGTSAFMGYSLAITQTSIWYKRSWATTIKTMADGLIYGLLTGGTFGWLWVR
jgi:hypothetical protein